MNIIETRTEYGYPVFVAPSAPPLPSVQALPVPEVTELETHGWWVETWASGMGWMPVFFGTRTQAERHLEILKNRGAWRDRQPRLTPCY